MKIYVKKVDGVTLPEKGTSVSAGYDIVATSDPKIVGEKTDENTWSRIDYIEYETNLYIAPTALTFHTLIHPRSSVSKYNLVLANSIGLVDNDYRGMVICRFKYIWQPENFSVTSNYRLLGSVDESKIYKKGDKIAQLVCEPTITVDWEFVDDLNQTQRGAGGFGSTDKSGKPITEIFADEVKKYESRQPNENPILSKYKDSGGIMTPVPYSERMKERTH